MSVTVHPGSFSGTFPVPASKSATHRALFLALLGRGGTIQAPLWSADTLASLRAIQAYGAKAVATADELVVRQADLQAAAIDAANAGTTLRLATAVAALCDGTSTLTGDDSLVQRPLGGLTDALEQIGARATCLGKQGRPPAEVTGPARGGPVAIAGDVSSQYVSALLLIGPRLPDGLDLTLTTDLRSAPYVALTIRMMAQAGLTVERTKGGFRVEPQEQRAVRLRVPGDYSAAAFPLVAGALTGGTVTLTGLEPESGQGDEALLDHLSAFGCTLERDGQEVTLTDATLQACELDLGDTPDLFPALAVLAAHAPGRTRLFGAPHLRDKESDRIAAVTEGLAALAITCEATADGAIIEGGQFTGGTVRTHGDHRIQMAFAIAALAAKGPVTLDGPADAHAVSYPTFFEQLAGANIVVAREEGA